MDDYTKTVSILRYRGGTVAQEADQVILERPFSVWLNGVCVEEGACIPDELEALALGHLLTEGYLSAPGEARTVYADQKTGRIEVEGDAHPRGDRFPHLPALAWEPETIMETAGRFLEGSDLFRATGTVHSALLVVDKKLYSAQCIGRHNAINKAVGLAMLAGTEQGGAIGAGVAFGRAILYTSGRLPISMAQKVIWAGIPMVVSRSAPTDAALELAARCGLNVIGFAGRDRMNLYQSK